MLLCLEKHHKFKYQLLSTQNLSFLCFFFFFLIQGYAEKRTDLQHEQLEWPLRGQDAGRRCVYVCVHPLLYVCASVRSNRTMCVCLHLGFSVVASAAAKGKHVCVWALFSLCVCVCLQMSLWVCKFTGSF